MTIEASVHVASPYKFGALPNPAATMRDPSRIEVIVILRFTTPVCDNGGAPRALGCYSGITQLPLTPEIRPEHTAMRPQTGCRNTRPG